MIRLRRIKYLLLGFIFLLLVIQFANAQSPDEEELYPPEFEPRGQTLPGENLGEVLPELEPLISAVYPFLKKLSLLVGGIFGLYLILIIARVHYERKKVRLLKDIRYDLDRLNMYHGVNCSRQKKGFFRKIINFIKLRSYSKKTKKNFKKK